MIELMDIRNTLPSNEVIKELSHRIKDVSRVIVDTVSRVEKWNWTYY